MALFPQFPYSNLHELNLDWLIEQISQLMKDGTVISVNGMSGIVTLYTDKDVVFPDLAFEPDWSVYRKIADKQAGLKFTGEKFYYITKNTTDEDFTVQEVFTSSNPPPYPVTSVNGQTGNVIISIPVTSVNGRTGDVVLAGDNIPYNIDGSYTIEDIITPLEMSIGHVIRYNTCAEGVSAGQYVYLILSGISGRSDGLYKAVNAKSAGTVWTAADLSPVAGGLGALMASNDSAISQLNSQVTANVEGTEIPNNSDLNNYTTPGRYITVSPGNAQSLSHRPWNLVSNAILEVRKAGTQIIQVVYEGYYKHLSQRDYDGTTWSEWYSPVNGAGPFTGNQTLDTLRSNIIDSGSSFAYMIDSLISGWSLVTACVQPDKTFRSIEIKNASKIVYTQTTNGGTSWTTGSISLS